MADIVAAVATPKHLKESEQGRLCGSITLAIEREIVMHDLISRDKGTCNRQATEHMLAGMH